MLVCLLTTARARVCVCVEGNIPVTVCYRCAAYYCLYLCAACTEQLDPWCSGLPLQQVSDVSETTHRRCSLMERDDLVEPKL